MGRIDFTPAIFIVGLAMVVIVIKYMGGIAGINKFIGSIFAVQPVAATPPPPAATPPAATPPAATPPAATPPAAEPGICPEGQTGNPATGGCFPGTCAERKGDPCTCTGTASDPGSGRAGTINGEPGTTTRRCLCACGGDGGDDEEDDEEDSGDGDGDGDGGGGDNGQNAEEFDEDSPAAKRLNSKIDQCRNFTGATHSACMGSLARRVAMSAQTVSVRSFRAPRVARVYNWGNA